MPFRSSEDDFLRRQNDWRAAHSQVGLGLDALIGRHVAEGLYDLSLTVPGREISSERKAAALRCLRESLVLPGSLEQPSDPEVISRRETEAYAVEEIEFTVTPPLRAPATVVIPKNGRARHPAVVALHCMGGMRAFGREKLLAFAGEPDCLTDYRSKYYGGRSWQEELARRGFLSIAIDAFNFGMRTSQALEDRKRFENERLSFSEDEAQTFALQAALTIEAVAARGLATAGLSLAGLVATDDLRTVDYLCTRGDVDVSRIGCAGLSFGAFRASYLSALDARIRSAVSVCWLSTLDGIVNYNITGAMGFFALPPGLYRRMDLADIVALSAPKPFLAISGWRDLLMQPGGIAQAHLRLRQHWQALEAGDQFGSLVYDTGHEFNPTMQEAAFKFFDRHLAGEADGPRP